MRTTEDLRAALVMLEEDAPTVEDVLSRIVTVDRRPVEPRRGRVLPTVTAALLTAAVVVVVVLGQSLGTAPRQAAAGGHAAGSLERQYGFSVGAVPGLAFTSGSLRQGVQWRTISTSDGLPIGTIEDGGSYYVSGGSALIDRRPITVAGHTAYFGQQRIDASDAPATGQRHASGQWAATVPVVAWPVQPGRWLLVRAAPPNQSGAVDGTVVQAWGTGVQARLVSIADAIDTSAPAPMLLPFRIGGVGAGVSAIAADSDTGTRTPGGSAVLVEYGMEVTVSVSRADTAAPVDDPSAKPVKVGPYSGEVNTQCSVQPAPTAPSGVSDHSDCQLAFRSAQWQVVVYLAGPGGSHHKITASQFVDIGSHLDLATNPTDPTTWFDAATALPQ